MEKWIAVYCSSSDALSQFYYSLSQDIGIKMVENDYNLVYGGGKVGMMAKVAQTVKNHGGKVIGVIPKSIHENVPAFDELDQLFVTDDMHSRKAKMESLADAFLILPGGFGTLEELLEVITLKQLNYHSKPIIIFNLDNFYGPMLAQFQSIMEKNFAKPSYRELFHIVSSVSEIFTYLEDYSPPKQVSKWFDTKNGFFTS
ncbi:hypothetical protein NEF87_000599 [Candidatus Lokiarchaeum ossiferum]|uniref:Cytokinin riboside 5'-monophosphate phosphoribohydrolase n=1 Tax=Candidatus Lokiarchaeum ossiferum TaxID=2951803 RepID=A0ABY6HP37_9ARCH|nr:hypothetical protein NEF87_000599 [Candidatus Lokiarchaeum sp. B-35]